MAIVRLSIVDPIIMFLPVDVDDVLLLGQAQRYVLGFFHVVTLDDDGGAEISTSFDFDYWRHRGHDDRDRDVQPFTVVAQRLRVIPE